MCQCYKIGGPFIAEDPDCYEHGTAAREREQEEREREQEVDMLRAEIAAWRTRFPQYRYRPQDDVVALS